MKKSLATKLKSLDGLNSADLLTVANYVKDLRAVEANKKIRMMKAMLKPGTKVNVIKGGELLATGVIDRVKTKKAIVKNFKYIIEDFNGGGTTYDVPLEMIKVA